MSVKMTGVYEGDLRCVLTHKPSGDIITTDAPLDNNGKGEAFSPTDLVGAALGTCIMTVMGIAAAKNNVDMRGSTVEIDKEMVREPVRRIVRLSVNIKMAKGIDPKQRSMLEEAAHNCPVHKSLNKDVNIEINIKW